MPPDARLAFVSRPFAPRQGGSIQDADAWCMADAAAAKLQGTFRAVLADIGRAAMDPSRFDSSKGAWYRLDRVPIVNKAADLLSATSPLLVAPLDLQADGHTRPIPLAAAWTGFG